MTKIIASKSKAFRSSRKKPENKATRPKRAAPKSEQSGSKRNSAGTRGNKQDQQTVKPSTLARIPALDVEGTRRRFPRPFLLPFAVMDMWFRAVEPSGKNK